MLVGVVFCSFVQLYSGVFMALVRSVTLDTSDMPTRRSPAVILSSTSTRQGSAKGRRSRARGSRIIGRRGGFPHPAPSQVPTGSLETKSIKFANITYSLLAGGVVTHINNVDQGTGNADRLGYKMRGNAVHLKGAFHIAQTGPQQSVCGYYLVWDKSPNLTLATPSNVFNINAGAGYDMSNTFPIDNDRFVVLKSYRRGITRGTGSSSMQLVNDFIKLPKTCVTGFVKGNGSGGIANTQTGALLLMPYRSVLTPNANADATDVVTLDLTTEFFFAEA